MITRPPSRTSSTLSPSCGLMTTRGSSAPSRITGGAGASGRGSSLGGRCCATASPPAGKRIRKRARRMAGFYPMVKTLLLVDGSSYLYRAFHALPELKSPRGEPTGAIHGVLSMLKRLSADYSAAARACVFDAKGKTFREDAYAQYKANRPSMPEDLASQIEPLKEAVAALGWTVLTMPGVEADDVIATLAEEARRSGWHCVISTGDKDLAQLVDERVTLVNTMSNEKLDPDGVRRKFGVTPAQIVDYLSLTGDAVDNVPGVEKVGPKTAAKWIQQYGSLDAVMAHAGEISGAVGENLRKALDWLPKGRELLTVKRDVKLPVGLKDLGARNADAERLAGFFERYGMKTMLREVQGNAPAAAPRAAAAALPSPAPPSAPAERRKYLTLHAEKDLADFLPKLAQAELVGFDTETTGLEPMLANLVGMSFAFGGDAWYLPLAHEYPGAPDQIGVARALALLGPWLEDGRKAKVGQKLKFVYEQIELPAMPVLLRMERNGVLIDGAKLDAQSHELGKEMLAKEQQAHEAAGQPFNLGSPKQIREILFVKQGLPVKKKTP